MFHQHRLLLLCVAYECWLRWHCSGLRHGRAKLAAWTVLCLVGRCRFANGPSTQQVAKKNLPRRGSLGKMGASAPGVYAPPLQRPRLRASGDSAPRKK